MIKSGVSIFLMVFIFTVGLAQDLNPKNPIELGLVSWNRDYKVAMDLAKQEQKPLLILFQEVPGCSNCTRFGREILSNPIVKDAIENYFVPICIYNNKRGDDAVILEKYKEPSWNNPVIRIVHHNERDMVERMWRFHPLEVFEGLNKALTKMNVDIPTYFRYGYDEVVAQYSNSIETAYFSMYCFWSGELKLGPIDGVVKTTSGFMDGREVVKVEYNAQVLSYSELVKQAKSLDCAHKAYTVNNKQKVVATQILGANRVESLDRFRPDVDVKYYLSKTNYRSLPMSSMQKIYINRAIAYGKDPHKHLSPSQIKLYKALNKEKLDENFIESDDIVGDWEKLLSALL